MKKNIQTHSAHINGQRHPRRHLFSQKRQHQPDPQHHRRTDNVKRPGVRGAQEEVEHAAAYRHRTEHGAEQQRRLPPGCRRDHLFLRRKERRAFIPAQFVGIVDRRTAQRAVLDARMQLHTAVDTVRHVLRPSFRPGCFQFSPTVPAAPESEKNPARCPSPSGCRQR